jgi:hypothetical protein
VTRRRARLAQGHRLDVAVDELRRVAHLARGHWLDMGRLDVAAVDELRRVAHPTRGQRLKRQTARPTMLASMSAAKAESFTTVLYPRDRLHGPSEGVTSPRSR